MSKDQNFNRSAEQKAKDKKDHDLLIAGIRKAHGNTMRHVMAKYSADSKPLLVDKGK